MPVPGAAKARGKSVLALAAPEPGCVSAVSRGLASLRALATALRHSSAASVSIRRSAGTPTGTGATRATWPLRWAARAFKAQGCSNVAVDRGLGPVSGGPCERRHRASCPGTASHHDRLAEHFSWPLPLCFGKPAPTPPRPVPAPRPAQNLLLHPGFRPPPCSGLLHPVTYGLFESQDQTWSERPRNLPGYTPPRSPPSPSPPASEGALGAELSLQDACVPEGRGQSPHLSVHPSPGSCGRGSVIRAQGAG